MTKKHLMVAVAILAACAPLVLAVLAILPPRPGISKANFDRITVGMSKAEIQEILGGAASITSPGGKTYTQLAGIHGNRTPDGLLHQVWGGDTGVAIIAFDAQELAVHTHWINPPPGFLKAVLNVFGL